MKECSWVPLYGVLQSVVGVPCIGRCSQQLRSLVQLAVVCSWVSIYGVPAVVGFLYGVVTVLGSIIWCASYSLQLGYFIWCGGCIRFNNMVPAEHCSWFPLNGVLQSVVEVPCIGCCSLQLGFLIWCASCIWVPLYGVVTVLCSIIWCASCSMQLDSFVWCGGCIRFNHIVKSRPLQIIKCIVIQSFIYFKFHIYNLVRLGQQEYLQY